MMAIGGSSPASWLRPLRSRSIVTRNPSRTLQFEQRRRAMMSAIAVSGRA
jgi:hypothetical protein